LIGIDASWMRQNLHVDTTYYPFRGLFDRFFPSLPFLGDCFRGLYDFPYAICLSL